MFKMRYLQLSLVLFFLLVVPIGLWAGDSVRHKFTALQLEVRVDGNFISNYNDTLCSKLATSGNDYGLKGQYFAFTVAGEFGKGFSYMYKQAINAAVGASSLFDNMEALNIQYSPNQHWAFRVGQDVVALGGFEYDAPPIDVYFSSFYWTQFSCYQLCLSASYTDKSEHNTLTLQFSNSPYVHFMGTDEEWKQGLFGYSLLWNGDFNHFKTLYSVNFFERKRGSFANYIALGNKFEFGPCSLYIDYQNRATDIKKYFADFTVVSRFDVRVKNVNMFVKGGYDQNMAEEGPIEEARDPMMTPGRSYLFYGLGVEYNPKGNKDLSIHFCVSNAVETDVAAKERYGAFNAKVGVIWNINFLRYFEKKLNPTK